jgi:hypothetical protein
MRDYLNAEIDRRKTEIAKIDAERDTLAQRRDVLVIELRVYAEILARSQETGNQELASMSQTPSIIPPPSSAALAAAEGVTRTKLIGHWRAVLQKAVERYPATIKNSEVPTIQRSAGYEPVRRPNIRTHFHKLVAEGLYERAGRGELRATKAAAELLGIPLGRSPEQDGRTTETPNSGELFGAPKGNGSSPLSL